MTTPSAELNPNQLKSRDLLLLELIRGATKSGIATDKKKANSKRACRGRYQEEA